MLAALLHDDHIVENVSVISSQLALFQKSQCSNTYEKMTFFGSRFLEKGRRSGSLFVVHSSMAHYRIQPGCGDTTVAEARQG